jgi:signal peptidase I
MTEKQPKKGKWKNKKWIIKTKKKPIEIPVKDVVDIGIFIVVLFMLTFGMFWILQASLHTKTPMVVVSSGSMTGTYNEGDLLFVRGEVNPAEIEAGDHYLKTGDVIVFEAIWSTSGDPIVHRVVNATYDSVEGIWKFRTWGDANPGPDQPAEDTSLTRPWVREDEIVGKVVGRIPWIGWVKLGLARTNLTIPIIIGLGLILVISIAWDLTHADKEDKKKKSDKNEDENSPSVNLGV